MLWTAAFLASGNGPSDFCPGGSSPARNAVWPDNPVVRGCRNRWRVIRSFEARRRQLAGQARRRGPVRGAVHRGKDFSAVRSRSFAPLRRWTYEAQGLHGCSPERETIWKRRCRWMPTLALAHDALAEAWQILGYDGNAQKEAKIAFGFFRRFATGGPQVHRGPLSENYLRLGQSHRNL